MSPPTEASPIFSGVAPDGEVSVRKPEVLRLDPLATAGWDERVGPHREACLFHSAAWAGVLRDTYGHTPNYFTVLDGERLSATLPVMEVKSPWTGRRGVSLPFTDECVLLSDGLVPADEILQAAIEFGRQRKWKYLECRGGKGVWAGRGTRPSLSFYSHVVPLSDGEEAIFSRMESSVRRGIRKAEKSGVEVNVSQTLESVGVFYSLHCKTRKKHGLPPQSFLFFENIFRHVVAPGMGCTVVASYRGRPIAASMFFRFRNRAIYKFGASDLNFQHLRPNNLVMWEAIRRYAGQGCDFLELGRTSMANEGLRRFKLGFGTTERTIDYFKYDFRKEAFTSDRDGVTGWFNGVFRCLPLSVSRMTGRLLYRHLS